MTYDEETYIIDSIKQIKREVHENNTMLRQIIEVINYWLSNANAENSNDFDRNVLANLISNVFELNLFNRK